MDYPSNSNNKTVAEKKKLDRIVAGNARAKKNSTRKLVNAFIPEGEDFKSYILYSVIVPNGKKIVSDIINTLIWGNPGGEGRKRGGNAHRVSYEECYDRRSNRRDYTAARNNDYVYDDVTFDDITDAKAVLDRMYEALEQYGSVSVADFFDLAGITAKYTDNKYGWYELRNARVVPTRGGYMIKLPMAVPLDN